MDTSHSGTSFWQSTARACPKSRRRSRSCANLAWPVWRCYFHFVRPESLPRNYSSQTEI